MTRDTLADKPPSTPLAPTSPKPQRAGIGTAFAINGSGEFLTNYHVVKSCTTAPRDRKSTRLNSSHSQISYAVFCLKKKKKSRVSALALAHSLIFFCFDV